MSTCRTSSTVRRSRRWTGGFALDSHEPDAYARLAEVLNYAGQPEKAIGLSKRPCASTPRNRAGTQAY